MRDQLLKIAAENAVGISGGIVRLVALPMRAKVGHDDAKALRRDRRCRTELYPVDLCAGKQAVDEDDWAALPYGMEREAHAVGCGPSLRFGTDHSGIDPVAANRQFCDIAGKQRVAPVLKANAYGHGLKEVYEALKDEAMPWLCVNYLAEAKILRDLGFKGRILVVGPPVGRELPLAAELDAEMTLGNHEVVQAWLKSKGTVTPRKLNTPNLVGKAGDLVQ